MKFENKGDREMTFKQAVKTFLDIIVPRFVTERVAVIVLDDLSYQVVCREKDLLPDDRYNFICSVRSFNLFGFAILPNYMDNESV